MNFSCDICCEDRPCSEEFRVDGCGHALCTACLARMAANGREMFACPFCKNPITNYGGEVAKERPRWAVDPEALLADDIEDDQLCDECGTTGLLVLCDVCDVGLHHTCAGINPAAEPDSWICASCSDIIAAEDTFETSFES